MRVYVAYVYGRDTKVAASTGYELVHEAFKSPLAVFPELVANQYPRPIDGTARSMDLVIIVFS